MIKNKKSKIFPFLPFISIVFIIIIISYLGSIYDELSANFNNYSLINDGWTLQNDSNIMEKVKLPYIYDEMNSLTHSINTRIPLDISKLNCIAFQNYHQMIHIYIENELIYSFGHNMPESYPIPANLWLFVPIEDEYVNKQIRIEFSSPVEYYAKVVPDVLIGEKSSILLFILKLELFGIIPSFLLLGLSAFLFITWVMIRKSLRVDQLLYLALFSFHIILWSATETPSLQFFVNLPSNISSISNVALMLVSYPVLLFFRESSKAGVKKVARILLFASWLHFIVINILQLTGILLLEESLIFTHINLVVSSIILIIAKIKAEIHTKKNRLVSSESIGFLILMATFLTDMYRYYTYQLYDYALFTRIGLLIFISILGINSMKYSLELILIANKAKVFEHLAYHDVLTGYYNRNAYEEYINKVKLKPEEWSKTIFFNVDLNNLKSINDNKGHDAGDLYIIANINFIMDFFESIGSCYRTGGDEFIIIINNSNTNIFFESLQRLQNNLAELNQNTSISFAYGFAIFDPTYDQNIQDTIKRADDEMYRKKVKMKGTI